MRTCARFLLAACLAVSIVGPAAALPSVDANTATSVELEAVVGIGPALAQRIIAERRNAPFRNLEDLRARVRGVGEVKLRRMRESGLVVGGGMGSGQTETIIGTSAGSAAAKGQARKASSEERQPGGLRWPSSGTATIVGGPR
jgi:competence protein ComEA